MWLPPKYNAYITSKVFSRFKEQIKKSWGGGCVGALRGDSSNEATSWPCPGHAPLPGLSPSAFWVTALCVASPPWASSEVSLVLLSLYPRSRCLVKAGLNIRWRDHHQLGPGTRTRGWLTRTTVRAELATVTSRRKSDPVQGWGEEDRDRVARASQGTPVLLRLTPIRGWQGQGAFRHPTRKAGSLTAESWLFLKTFTPSLWVTPQPDPEYSVITTSPLSKFPVKLRLGHNWWYQMLHRK